MSRSAPQSPLTAASAFQRRGRGESMIGESSMVSSWVADCVAEWVARTRWIIANVLDRGSDALGELDRGSDGLGEPRGDTLRVVALGLEPTHDLEAVSEVARSVGSWPLQSVDAPARAGATKRLLAAV